MICHARRGPRAGGRDARRHRRSTVRWVFSGKTQRALSTARINCQNPSASASAFTVWTGLSYLQITFKHSQITLSFLQSFQSLSVCELEDFKYFKKLVSVFLGLHKSVTGHIFMWTKIAYLYARSLRGIVFCTRGPWTHLNMYHIHPHPPHTKYLVTLRLRQRVSQGSSIGNMSG